MLDPNQRLGEQLRKLLDEQNLAGARRVMELATEIKQSAVQLTANPPDNNTFLWVETDPAVDMPLERPLWTPPITTSYADIEPEVVLINLSAIDLKALFDQFYVDESRLHRHIAAPSRMMKNLPS